jgi:HEAT repeats
MVMDDASSNPAHDRRCLSRLLLVCALAVAGCTTWVGTTAKSFLRHVRNDPDPNVRYLAYSKLADLHAYDSEEEKNEAVRILIEKFDKGHEPIATRAMICRTLGQLRDPRARDLLIKAVSSPEAVIKIESCRALGKVGRPEDATILAQVMTLDNLEDARIAAIEGLGEIKTKDPRIYQMLVENMDHDDPAIRLASLNALRKLTGKDHGTNPADWRRKLKPLLDPASPSAPAPSRPADAAIKARPAAAAASATATRTP